MKRKIVLSVSISRFSHKNQARLKASAILFSYFDWQTSYLCAHVDLGDVAERNPVQQTSLAFCPVERKQLSYGIGSLIKDNFPLCLLDSPVHLFIVFIQNIKEREEEEGS